MLLKGGEKVTPSQVKSVSASDLTPSGVRVFNAVPECGGIDKDAYQDPTVHTVIINRVNQDGSALSSIIAHKRNEAPEVRDYLDPTSFNKIKCETINWDVTYHRFPL